MNIPNQTIKQED